MTQSKQVLVAGALSLLLLAGCSSSPYFSADGPQVETISPAFENGNLGGEVVLERYKALSLAVNEGDDPSDEQVAALESMRDNFLVVISGNFEGCSDADQPPLVVFGSRTAEIVEHQVNRILVFTPPGPVAGGLVLGRISRAHENALADKTAQLGEVRPGDGGQARVCLAMRKRRRDDCPRQVPRGHQGDDAEEREHGLRPAHLPGARLSHLLNSFVPSTPSCVSVRRA